MAVKIYSTEYNNLFRPCVFVLTAINYQTIKIAGSKLRTGKTVKQNPVITTEKKNLITMSLAKSVDMRAIQNSSLFLSIIESTVYLLIVVN
jgi:hypothetical protein